ncbi:MAG: hypothetical protein NTV05_08715 [Acidobacteria bacterium]|nr:hypothetical protein [Acidobacteriota bacterium]
MGASRPRLVTAVALMAILAAVIWWQYASPPAPAGRSAATAAPSGQHGASVRPDAPRVVPVVALARLSREAPEPSDTGRDPFRFAARGPVSGRAGEVGTAPRVASAPPPVPTRVEPAGPPPPPPIPFKFIAVVSRREGVRIAMLSDGRGVYYGSEGSVIEGQYRIVRIGLDSIEMTYLDGRGRRVIPLSGS